MFENLCEIKTAFDKRDLPTLRFDGGTKHPLNLIVMPCVAVGVFIIFVVFILLAIVIDFCNLFVKTGGT